MDDWRDKRVAVVGMGRSGLAAAELLGQIGAHPRVSDAGGEARLQAACQALSDQEIPFETGGHSPTFFEDVDAVVLSPGVPADCAPAAWARARGALVLGELELAWRHCRAPVIAVTGTNGKTTTTALVRALLNAAGRRTALAGNNETAFSSVVLGPAPDNFVLEVSSYQLETVDAFRPRIAAVLNVTPDHLGRHGEMTGYAAVKARIFARQGAGDSAIVNADDPHARGMPTPPAAQRRSFGLEAGAHYGLRDGVFVHGDTPLAPLDALAIPGRHNQANALAALAIGREAGLEPEALHAGLRAFRGVPHRIEFVAKINGVAYYNDSKSTNVDSLRVALESFPGRIVLIAGGEGKGAGYAGLRPLASARLARLITLGQDAPRIEADLADCAPIERAGGMADAVRRAWRAAGPGDVVLLSPGCASFDMYANFEERGEDFKACVRALPRECAVSGGNEP